MPKEEIVEGLKAALARGGTLQKAMMSFYNAGYLKQDIEEAARILQSPQLPSQTFVTQSILQATKPQQQMQKAQIKTESETSSPFSAPENPFASVSQPENTQTQQPKVIQRVSNYDKKPRRLSGLVISVLVFLLIFLIGILVSVFLFKEQFAAFFTKIIS